MLNIELLKKVRESILANPSQFNIAEWDSCIAGFTCHVAKVECVYHDLTAARLLGLDEAQRSELFHAAGLDGYAYTLEHAQAGAARIDAFIAKYAPEPVVYRFDVKTGQRSEIAEPEPELVEA